MARKTVDTKARVIVLALKAAEIPQAEIVNMSGLSQSTVKRICAKAVRQGFDPAKRPLEIQDSYLGEDHCAEEASPNKQKQSAKLNEAPTEAK
jgi:hypothetical protein